MPSYMGCPISLGVPLADIYHTAEKCCGKADRGSGRLTLAGIATILQPPLAPFFAHSAFAVSMSRSTWTFWHRTRNIPHRLSPWLPAMAEALQSAKA